ncbi:MAG: PepSY-associated TM helix domain-containing protein [Pseudomonadota bacterium]
MLRERYLRIYDLHSWSGVVLGLFIFVVSLTGCFALFDHEIKTWEDQNLRAELPANPTPIHDTFTAWVKQTAGENKVQFATMIFPSNYEPYYHGLLQFRDADNARVFEHEKWHASSGEMLPHREGGLSEWLLDFHRDLMWPESLGGRQVGRAIVGIAGIVLMISILSGIIAHTKIVREFFTLRFQNTIRLKWTDTHKVLGLWVMPFYTMIAFTGAFLGIIVIMSPIIAALSFKGDTEALIDAVIGPPTEPRGVMAQMLSIDEVRALQNPGNGEFPYSVVSENWGDEAAEYRIFYPVQKELGRFELRTISGVSGELIKSEPINELSSGNRVSASIAPLHYGTYGGFWLKVLYFILGLSLCVVTATGLMMWIERRLHGKEGNRSQQFYQRLGKLVIGVTLGLPVATASIFYLDKLYTGIEDSRLWWTGTSYFLVWLACILFSMVARIGEYKLVKGLFLLNALLFIGIPVMHWQVVPGSFSTGTMMPWMAVDVALLIFGLCLLVLAQFLPKHRIQPERNRPKKARQIGDQPVSAGGI